VAPTVAVLPMRITGIGILLLLFLRGGVSTGGLLMPVGHQKWMDVWDGLLKEYVRGHKMISHVDV
jgi:hypothetical protein